MVELKNKRVLVVGYGSSGRAACQLLQRRGSTVLALDAADTESLRRAVAAPDAPPVRVRLGVTALPDEPFDLAVVSPGVPCEGLLMQAVYRRGIPVIGELELGYQQSACPNLAVTGTNGKTTTTELIERMLTQCGLKTVAAGNIGLPWCAVAERSRELDWLTIEVSSFQLETIETFRPRVAILLNITPDHLDRYASMADYIRAKARLFLNQQATDWAVIQTEALAPLRALGLSVPARMLTFSATETSADLYLEQGWVTDRLPEWPGRWLDLSTVRLRGPHNAENLMATLAAGRILALPEATMLAALRGYAPAPHRCELVAEAYGIQFINDSKATNVDAVRQALRSVRPGPAGAPNVWLIAGGKDKGFDYGEVGPLLRQRVKGAILVGETREKIRAAWSAFTPCTLADSLIEAVSEAARTALSGDVVLLSPACSSFDMFQNYQHRGEVFRQAVETWLRDRPSATGHSGEVTPS